MSDELLKALDKRHGAIRPEEVSERACQRCKKKYSELLLAFSPIESTVGARGSKPLLGNNVRLSSTPEYAL
jgi:hypothetical protein